MPTIANKSKTHCPRGHPYDAVNTYLTPRTGLRHCRECKRAASRAAYIPRVRKLKTHCSHGHLLDLENTGVLYSGKRYCKKCDALRKAGVPAERARRYSQTWRQRNPDKVKAKMRCLQLKQYNITPAIYNEMLAMQGGVCAVCKETCSTGRNLAVDHDHKTGLVRGLLCCKCNRGLGYFGDDVAKLAGAISYLLPAYKMEGGS